GQRDQLEVAVDLPQVLDVADSRRVAVIDCETELERRLDPGLGIGIPAGGEAERRILKGEHVEAALEDFVGRTSVAPHVETARQRRYPRLAGGARGCGRVREADAGAL